MPATTQPVTTPPTAARCDAGPPTPAPLSPATRAPSPADTLRITVTCLDDGWTLGLDGDLDMATGHQLTELGALLGGGRAQSVTLDLSGLDFIDTAGLHSLARTCELVRGGDGRASIAGTTAPAVARLLSALEGCGITIDLSDGVGGPLPA